MKNIVYILLLLPLLSFGQIIEFEDEKFKSCILSQVDNNNDMEVDQQEALIVKEIVANCDSYDVRNIGDLKYFKNVEKIQLYIVSTSMEELELDSFLSLKELTINSAGLSINVLIFRNIPLLEKFNFGSTYNLENIFFEKLPLLKSFSIDAIGSMDYLDLSDLPMLESIGFSSCIVERLNLKNGKIVTDIYLDSSLKEICVDENEITHYQTSYPWVEIKSNCESLGVPQFDFSDEFVLFPNPIKNNLTIDPINGLNIISVSIANMFGQTVSVTNSSTVDTSSLPQGMYIVTVKTNKGNTTTKIIKE